MSSELQLATHPAIHFLEACSEQRVELNHDLIVLYQKVYKLIHESGEPASVGNNALNRKRVYSVERNTEAGILRLRMDADFNGRMPQEFSEEDNKKVILEWLPKAFKSNDNWNLLAQIGCLTLDGKVYQYDSILLGVKADLSNIYTDLNSQLTRVNSLLSVFGIK